ncbi:MAG: hypothetical protein ACK55I_42215, partial [bacterium]
KQSDIKQVNSPKRLEFWHDRNSATVGGTTVLQIIAYADNSLLLRKSLFLSSSNLRRAQHSRCLFQHDANIVYQWGHGWFTPTLVSFAGARKQVSDDIRSINADMRSDRPVLNQRDEDVAEVVN